MGNYSDPNWGINLILTEDLFWTYLGNFIGPRQYLGDKTFMSLSIKKVWVAIQKDVWMIKKMRNSVSHLY